MEQGDETKADNLMRVLVVYGSRQAVDQQHLRLPREATIAMAIADSGVVGRHPELRDAGLAVSVFGRLRQLDTKLQPGDRVEILRPLLADPKERRRTRAVQRRRSK